MSRLTAFVLAGVLGLGAGLFSTPAHATVMREVALEEMIRQADLIVRGVVEQSDVALSLENGTRTLETVTQIRVTEWLKGSGGSIATVRELGGIDEQLGSAQWFAGTPQYARGEEVIVFLRWDENVQGHRTFAMAQGKFRIMHGVPGVPTTVTRDLEAISFAEWADEQMRIRPAQDVALQLDGFLDLIKHTLESLPAGGAR